MLGAVGQIPPLAGTAPVRPAEPSAVTGTDPATSFVEVLARMSREGIRTLETAEAAAIGGVRGSASVQDVVEAIVSAEQTLQTAIAIRDRVVSAYQEVSRMTI